MGQLERVPGPQTRRVHQGDRAEFGNYFGRFSLSIVVYDLDLGKVDRASAEFYKVFSVHDAQLYEEKYNLLNAFLATIPGNLAGLVSTGVEG